MKSPFCAAAGQRFSVVQPCESNVAETRERPRVWARFTARRSLHFPFTGGLFLANTSMNAVVSPQRPRPTPAPSPHGLVVWQQQRQRRNVCRTTWHTYQSMKVPCCYCAKSQRVHAALCLLSVCFSRTCFAERHSLMTHCHFTFPAAVNMYEHSVTDLQLKVPLKAPLLEGWLFYFLLSNTTGASC